MSGNSDVQIMRLNSAKVVCSSASDRTGSFPSTESCKPSRVLAPFLLDTLNTTLPPAPTPRSDSVLPEMPQFFCTHSAPDAEKALTNETRQIATFECRATYWRASARETRSGLQTDMGGLVEEARGEPERMNSSSFVPPHMGTCGAKSGLVRASAFVFA